MTIESMMAAHRNGPLPHSTEAGEGKDKMPISGDLSGSF
ncbi:hypothetical protein EPIR_2276 [Erwinia piriflorinigrans CFBP 5888]|uniref:Uncharacterized protein n=1 Tax=Erwinia piriflorinigrans CFBP 5888 TaxID=1161919 RepID=V5Z9D6_9GAMM|nr:hypothetical protein EPIR_2276 [Erwinia piriflorinigrans CFBP 5888]